MKSGTSCLSSMIDSCLLGKLGYLVIEIIDIFFIASGEPCKVIMDSLVWC